MMNTTDNQHKAGHVKYPLSLAFSPLVMSLEHASAVIDHALDYRGDASDSVRSRLNSAIKDSVTIPGFRDASRASRQQLRDPVLAEIMLGGEERLAGAVLRAWVESQEALRAVVTEHLGARGISAEDADFQGGAFESTWPQHEWATESELIASEEYDAEDVALMLCCVSGRVPVEETQVEMESPLFQGWLDELSELPPGAPEWDYAEEFATSLTGIAWAKIAERVTVQIEAVANSITEIRDEFDAELRYLEIDLSAWSADDVARSDQIETALERLADLKSALIEYRPVRPQASSRSEESERAPERERCEKLILDIVAAWDEAMIALEAQDDDPPPEASLDHPAEGASDDSPSTTETDAVQTVLDAIQERDSTNSEIDRLQQENDRLRQDGDDLRADKSLLGEQISRLKDELSRSRDMQEYWRRAYVSESAGQARPQVEQPAQLASVNDALELAERSFPGRLRLALNSKSAKNSTFQKPDEVFDALAWLATEYHRRRSNPGDAPNFDKLIKEACPGWSYKPKQTEVTKEQFAEWYTTTLDGKSYELDAHVGKGNSFNPHQTIRIAFDWDDELRQVIVGYVGRHQRNRRS